MELVPVVEQMMLHLDQEELVVVVMVVIIMQVLQVKQILVEAEEVLVELLMELTVVQELLL